MESTSFNLSRKHIFKMMKLLSLVTLFVLFSEYLVESGRRYMIDGYKYYISYPDEYYFYQSLEYCAHNGMFLVDIRTEEETVHIMSIMQSAMKYWNIANISLWTSGTNANQDSNKFIWLNSGREVLYNYWRSNHPSSGGNLFILAKSDDPLGGWVSSKDNVNASLICRDKLDDSMNAHITNRSKSSGMHVHKRKTAREIKLRRKHKHG